MVTHGSYTVKENGLCLETVTDWHPTWEVKEYFWLLHAKETGISYSGLGHLVYVQKSFFKIKKGQYINFLDIMAFLY